MNKLLSEYLNFIVSSILKEEEWADQTPPARPLARKPAPQEKFSFETLDSIDNIHQQESYLTKTLKNIGVGSGRSVYQLNDNQVVKIALNDQGIDQNKEEIAVCKLDPQKEFFTKVFKVGKNNHWIVAEKATPITPEIFKEKTGIDWKTFNAGLFGSFADKLTRPVRQGELNIAQELTSNNKFFANLIKILKGCNFEPSDVSKIDSWGMVNDRLVVLDYGLTSAVVNQHKNNLTRVVA